MPFESRSLSLVRIPTMEKRQSQKQIPSRTRIKRCGECRNLRRPFDKTSVGIFEETTGISHETRTVDSFWCRGFNCEENHDNIVLGTLPSSHSGVPFFANQFGAAIFRIRDQGMAKKPEDRLTRDLDHARPPGERAGSA